jgi:periplasmic divalent cation tolerance protein
MDLGQQPRFMKTSARHRLVFVTVPDATVAKRLTQAILEARAAACVNIVHQVESHYWWKDQIECSTELLLILKTDKSRLAELERIVLDLHPYETPEFIVSSLEGGAERYLNWIDQNIQVRDPGRSSSRERNPREATRQRLVGR